MNKQELFTESALVDSIKQCWIHTKTSDFPNSGDCYYKIIDEGILFNKEIKIPLNHFDKELNEVLNNQSPQTIKRVIFTAIKEIAQEKFGSRDFTDRIKWRFV